MGGQCHTPAILLPGKIWYALYRLLGGPQGQSGWVRKISPPTGFNPRTVQPVASRYNYYLFMYICQHLCFSELLQVLQVPLGSTSEPVQMHLVEMAPEVKSTWKKVPVRKLSPLAHPHAYTQNTEIIGSKIKSTGLRCCMLCHLAEIDQWFKLVSFSTILVNFYQINSV